MSRHDPLAGARTVVVGGSDLNGVFRAKQVPAAGFAGSPPSVAFSDGIWAMDSDDALQQPPPGYPHWFPSWERGYGEVHAIPDMETLRAVPWRERTAMVLCDFAFPDSTPVAVAPRTVLRRAVERLGRSGFQLRVAPELEFVLLRESEDSLERKGYRCPEPLSARGQAYGATRAAADADLIESLRDQLGALGVQVETWAPEGPPGQYELTMPPSNPLRAADDAFVFKHAVKEVALRHDLLASFMPRLGAGHGNGLHVHQSLRDADGSPRSADPRSPHGISAPFRHAIGGQLATARELALLLMPTVNDYKRSVANTAAGTTATWGVDNRTVALRLLPRDAGKCRVEHRVPGAAANVYLVLAALLAGAAHGIEGAIEPPDLHTGNAYTDPNAEPLPRSLEEAISEFESSAVARQLLGEEFVAHYAVGRRWEAEQFAASVTDWELRRYLLRS